MAQVSEEKDGVEPRSGRYPGVALEGALGAAEKLYKAERHAPVDNATAAKHMGYKSLSGPARVMIGALRQYGLIARVGDGRFKLSKLSIEALHGTDAQKADARKTAALNPSLFAELSHQHLGASEDNISSYLITERGFIDRGARIAARAFRETVQFANVTDSGYDVSMNGGDDEINAAGTEDRPMQTPPAPATGVFVAAPPAKSTVATQGEVERVRVSLKGGRLARIVFTGDVPTQADIAKVIASLELQKDSFPDGD